MKNLVSVIIPIYNGEKYLNRCLASVLNQTYKEIEIILVNDGSTDGTSLICETCASKDTRIKIINQNNLGLGAARNSGIEAAQGEWLCFVDCDDYIDCCFVENLLKIAVEHKCRLVQCRLERTHNDSFIINQPKPTIQVMDWRTFNIYLYSHRQEGHHPFSCCVCFYHKSLFERVRFTSHRCGEDNFIMPSILKTITNESFAVTSQYLYYWFQSENSLTRGSGKLKDTYLEHIRAVKEVVTFYESINELELASLAWGIYFETLVTDYVEIHLNLNAETDYTYLLNEITAALDKAKKYCHTLLNINMGASEVWGCIADNKKQVVLYGYGVLSKIYILPWLKLFNINIVEIWDQNSLIGEFVKDIPKNKPHGGLKEDTLIIIGIHDECIALSVQYELRQLGYKNFIKWPEFNNALRYTQYDNFLPLFLN